MPRMHALCTLHAGACEMDDSGLAALAAGLPHALALRAMYLAHNRIGDAGVQALVDVLPRCVLLADLELFGNRYSAREMGALDAVGGTRLQIFHEDPEEDPS